MDIADFFREFSDQVAHRFRWTLTMGDPARPARLVGWAEGQEKCYAPIEALCLMRQWALQSPYALTPQDIGLDEWACTVLDAAAQIVLHRVPTPYKGDVSVIDLVRERLLDACGVYTSFSFAANAPGERSD